VKLFGGQTAKAGNIIVRQKGSKYITGENTYMGRDFTIHALVDGVVKFTRKKIVRFDGRKYERTVVNVVSAK
jgi:large subunit ribosomal protein L27